MLKREHRNKHYSNLSKHTPTAKEHVSLREHGLPLSSFPSGTLIYSKVTVFENILASLVVDFSDVGCVVVPVCFVTVDDLIFSDVVEVADTMVVSLVGGEVSRDVCTDVVPVCGILEDVDSAVVCFVVDAIDWPEID